MDPTAIMLLLSFLRRRIQGGIAGLSELGQRAQENAQLGQFNPIFGPVSLPDLFDLILRNAGGARSLDIPGTDRRINAQPFPQRFPTGLQRMI